MNTKSKQKEAINIGQLFMTQGVNRQMISMPKFREFTIECINRHQHQDWGDRPTPDANRDECLGDIQGREPLSGRAADKPWDHQVNDYNLKHGGRIISSYNLPKGLQIRDSYQRQQTRVWIITEANRAYTTVLFPSEY